MINRLRVVELEKLEKQARANPSQWSSKKFTATEANVQMGRFLKKLGCGADEPEGATDDMYELNKEGLQESTAIGISLL